MDNIIEAIKAIAQRADGMAAEIAWLGSEHGRLQADLRELLTSTEGVNAEVGQAKAVLQSLQALATNSLVAGPSSSQQQGKEKTPVLEESANQGGLSAHKEQEKEVSKEQVVEKKQSAHKKQVVKTVSKKPVEKAPVVAGGEQQGLHKSVDKAKSADDDVEKSQKVPVVLS